MKISFYSGTLTCLLILIILCSSSCKKERISGPGTIKGTVTDSVLHKPLKANILLLPKQDSTSADEQGFFIFNNLDSLSNYSLIAKKDGYITKKIEGIHLAPGEKKNYSIMFFLKESWQNIHIPILLLVKTKILKN